MNACRAVRAFCEARPDWALEALSAALGTDAKIEAGATARIAALEAREREAREKLRAYHDHCGAEDAREEARVERIIEWGVALIGEVEADAGEQLARAHEERDDLRALLIEEQLARHAAATRTIEVERLLADMGAPIAPGDAVRRYPTTSEILQAARDDMARLKAEAEQARKVADAATFVAAQCERRARARARVDARTVKLRSDLREVERLQRQLVEALGGPALPLDDVAGASAAILERVRFVRGCRAADAERLRRIRQLTQTFTAGDVPRQALVDALETSDDDMGLPF